jgi:hypothetical protein
MSSQQPPPQAGETTTLDSAWLTLRFQQQKELAQFDHGVELNKLELKRQFDAELAESRRRFEVCIADTERSAHTKRSQLLVCHEKQDQSLRMHCAQNARSSTMYQEAPTTPRQAGLPLGALPRRKETVSKGNTITSQQARPATPTNTSQDDRSASATQTAESAIAANQMQTARTPTATPKKAWPTTPKKTPRTYDRRRTKYDGFTVQPTPELEKNVEIVSLLSDDEDDMPLMLRLARSKGTPTVSKTLFPGPAPLVPYASTKHPNNGLVSSPRY